MHHDMAMVPTPGQPLQVKGSKSLPRRRPGARLWRGSNGAEPLGGVQSLPRRRPGGKAPGLADSTGAPHRPRMYNPLTDQAAPPDIYTRHAPPPPTTSLLAAHRHVAAAVIGAGFTGLSAALHLAEAGIEVAVLEANHIG